MPETKVQTPKPKKAPAKKSAPAFSIPDIRYGSPEGQAQMNAFLTTLTPTDRSAIEHFLAVWKPGTPAWNDGYRKLFRYTKAWFGNVGKTVSLD
jgi:hypothetical protein